MIILRACRVWLIRCLTPSHPTHASASPSRNTLSPRRRRSAAVGRSSQGSASGRLRVARGNATNQSHHSTACPSLLGGGWGCYENHPWHIEHQPTSSTARPEERRSALDRGPGASGRGSGSRRSTRAKTGFTSGSCARKTTNTREGSRQAAQAQVGDNLESGSACLGQGSSGNARLETSPGHLTMAIYWLTTCNGNRRA